MNQAAFDNTPTVELKKPRFKQGFRKRIGESVRATTKKQKLIAAVVVALVICAACTPVYLHAISVESTDDAFVDGRIVQIAPQVPGRILTVYVMDNQYVKQGEPLIEIDPSDYRLRLDAANAALAIAQAKQHSAEIGVDVTKGTTTADLAQADAGIESATAAVERARAQFEVAKYKRNEALAHVTIARSSVEQARAQVTETEAEATRAQLDVARFRRLASSGNASQQQLDQAIARDTSARSQVVAAHERVVAATGAVEVAVASERAAVEDLKRAEAEVAAAEGGVSEARGRRTDAEVAPSHVAEQQSLVDVAKADVEHAQAAVQQAVLDLAHTKVYAPESGRITRKTVEPGATVVMGQGLLALVADQIWITANFKETQLERMRPGQPVRIKVDAYPHLVLEGHVESIQSGTGARFSLLPPENATGNYVKVVQRVPVKIALDNLPDSLQLLGPGMSVTPEVQTR